MDNNKKFVVLSISQQMFQVLLLKRGGGGARWPKIDNREPIHVKLPFIPIDKHKLLESMLTVKFINSVELKYV